MTNDGAKSWPLPGQRYYCPCCGSLSLGQNAYANLHQPPFGDLGEPPYDERFGDYSHEGCHSCGYQFGYDDEPMASGRATSFAEYRQRWIAGGCKWFCGDDPRPQDWSLMEQLAKAGIPWEGDSASS